MATTTEIYIEGALEPLRTLEPFQSTMAAMSANMQHNMMFFMTEDTEGNKLAIEIHKVTHLRELAG